MTDITHEQLVEKAAQEICHAGIGELVFECWDDEQQEVFRRRARAALAAAELKTGE